MGPIMTDYRSLKLACIARGQLYEDPDFPSLSSSIFNSRKVPSDVYWARPKAVCSAAEFTASVNPLLDLDPGCSESTAFSCAAALIALKPLLFKKVVPPAQDFGVRYTGLFHFNIWQHGAWREVVIDDRLPVRDGRPAFCHNRVQTNEFWCALLEKAYAKLYGSYEALEQLMTSDILVDLTGGVSDIIEMPSRPPKGLYQVMNVFSNKNTIMACTIPEGGSKHGGEQKRGLSKGATYLVKQVIEKTKNGSKSREKFVIIRDTRQRSKESMKSLPWFLDGQQYGLDNSEICLPYRTWKKHFDQLVLCHLSLEEDSKQRWYVNSEACSWKAGESAGGAGNPPDDDLYWTNPQLRLHVKAGPSKDSEKITMVSVMQTSPIGTESPAWKAMGLDIYKIPEHLHRTDNKKVFARDVLELYRSTEAYSDVREVTLRTTLPIGQYVIIPSTFHSNENSDFLVRVVSETRIALELVAKTLNFNSPFGRPLSSDFGSSPNYEQIFGIGHRQFTSGLTSSSLRSSWEPPSYLYKPQVYPASSMESTDATTDDDACDIFNRTTNMQNRKRSNKRLMISQEDALGINLSLDDSFDMLMTKTQKSSNPESTPEIKRGCTSYTTASSNQSENISVYVPRRGREASPVREKMIPRSKVAKPPDLHDMLFKTNSIENSYRDVSPVSSVQKNSEVHSYSSSSRETSSSKVQNNRSSRQNVPRVSSDPYTNTPPRTNTTHCIVRSPDQQVPLMNFSDSNDSIRSPSPNVRPRILSPERALNYRNTQLSSSEASYDSDDTLVMSPEFRESPCSERIDAFDLQKILLGFNSSVLISLETCRNLLMLFDSDSVGSVSDEQANLLWDELSHWEEAFVCLTGSSSSSLRPDDVADALQLLEISVDADAQRSIVCRYGSKDGTLAYTDFLSCVARCKTAFEVFDRYVTSNRCASFNIQQFMQSFMR